MKAQGVRVSRKVKNHWFNGTPLFIFHIQFRNGCSPQKLINAQILSHIFKTANIYGLLWTWQSRRHGGGLAPPRQSYKPPQNWNTINRVFALKPPYWRLSGDGSGTWWFERVFMVCCAHCLYSNVACYERVCFLMWSASSLLSLVPQTISLVLRLVIGLINVHFC